MTTQTTTRKQVRRAIVETAEALTALKPQWAQRDDLTALAAATKVNSHRLKTKLKKRLQISA